MEEDPQLSCVRDSTFAQCGMTKRDVSVCVRTYTNLGLWVLTSISLIILNKFILVGFGFPFPCTLTIFHMVVCSAACWALILSKAIEVTPVPAAVFTRGVFPVAILFSVSLYFNNLAYRFLSVSTLQMIKASTPAIVYVCGVAFKLDEYDGVTLGNMLVIVFGVALASLGDVDFNVPGLVVQCAAIFAEGMRIVLIQVLLQSRGVKLNPISTMAYVLPCCAVCLVPVWATYEWRTLSAFTWTPDQRSMAPYLFALNGLNAFVLNYAVFLAIGKNTALTMNVAGVVKDFGLISISCLVFGDIISRTSWCGYAVAFLGVAFYQRRKLHAMHTEASKKLDSVPEEAHAGAPKTGDGA